MSGKRLGRATSSNNVFRSNAMKTYFNRILFTILLPENVMKARSNRVQCVFVVATAIAAATLAAQPAMSATLSWNTGSATWSTASTNWNGATVGTPWDSTNGPSDIAYFNQSSPTVTVSSVYANGLYFDNTATLNSSTITLAGTSPTITVNASGGATISSTLAGSAGLIKSGTGKLTLSAASNSFTGGTTVSSGTLAANGGNNGSGALGTGNVTVNNGGTITTQGDNAFLGYTTSSGKAVQVNAGGLIIQASSNTCHLNALVLNGGTLSATTASTQYGNWDVDFGVSTPNNGTTSYITGGNLALTEAGGTIFNIAANDTINLSAAIQRVSNTGVTDTGLIKTGAGLLNLGSLSNTYTSTTTVRMGTLQVGAAGAIPTGSGKGNVTFDTAANTAVLDLNGFDTTINGLIGNTASTTNMVVNDASGSTHTLTVGNNNVSSTFSGVLANNNNAGTGVLALTKTGNGTLTLGGNNSFTGPTTLAAGGLNLNGTNATTSISTSAGTTLGGNGSAYSATASVASGATISAGYNGAGTLGLGGLTFLGGGTVSVANGAIYGSTPAVSVTTLTTSSSPITISVGGTFAAGAGTMHVIGYSGSIAGSGFGAFSLASPVSSGRSSYTLANDAGFVDLAYAVDYPIWTGAGNGMWTTSNQSPNYNWTLAVAGTGTNYLAGDMVYFGNNATNTTVTISDSSVKPSSVTVNNDGAHNYIFTGSGSIAGSTGLTKSGTGTLDISALTNSYSGATTILGGTVYAGSDANLGFAPTSATAGKIALNGGALSANNSFTLNSNRGIALGPAGGSGSGTIDVSGTNSLSYGGVMANAAGGTGGLIKTGSGTLVLTNRESYTGPTAINGGVVELNISNGATGVFNVASAVSVTNATIKLDSDNSYGGYGDGSGGPGGAEYCAPLTINAGGQVTAGGSTHIGQMTLQGGTLASFGYNTLYGGWFLNGNITASGSTTSTISAQNVLVGNGQVITFTVNAGSILNFNGSTQGTYGPTNLSSGTLNAAGAGLLVVTGANAQSGGTTLSGGTTQLGNGGSSGDLGPAPIVNNAVLAFNRNDNPVYTNSLSGTGTIAQIGTGIVTLSGSIKNGATPSVLHMQGPGTLILTGSNTYSGATTISSGKLYVNGMGAIANSTGITVNSGAIFGGNSSTTIASPVSGLNGGTIDCGDGTGNGNLTLQSLTLGSSPSDHTYINTYLGSTTATLNVVGSNALVASGTAAINVLGSNLSPGTFTLINYSGAIGGSGSGAFQLGSLPTRVVGSLVNTPDTGSGGNIALDITAIDRPIWTGTTNNKWDTNSANLNWTGYYYNTAQYYFETGDQVQFDDTANNGSGPLTVNVAANVTPSSVNFLNNATSYTLTGSGAITGASTTLSVAAGGLVVLANGANSYGGQTTITSGTLQVGNGGAAGQLGTDGVVNGGVLVLDRSDSVTVANSIGGGGAIIAQGGGTVTFSGGPFTGLLTVQAGTLVAAGQNALGGSGGQGAVVLPGATFDINGQNLGYKSGVSGNSITISGSGAGGNGAIINSGAAQANALQSVVLAANATIGGAGMWEIGAPLSQTPAVNGTLNLAGFTLTKTGSNEVDLLNTNVTDGNIVVHLGTLGVFQGTSLLDYGSGATVQVDSGAMLELIRNATGTITRPIVMNGGTLRTTNGGSGTGVTIGSNITFAASTTSTLLADQSSGLTLSGSLSGAGNVVKAAAVGGAANLNITGNASGFSGTWTQNSGITYLSSANAASALANYVIQTTDPSVPAILAANSASAILLNLGSLSGSSGSLESTAAGPATFVIGGNVAPGSGTTYGGVIQNGSSTVAIQIAGSGSMLLAGPNAYTGGTTVTSGLLQLGNTAALGTGALAANGGTLDLAGYSVTVPSFSGAGGIVTNSNPASVAVFTASQSGATVFSGALQNGAGQTALTMNGNGALTLSGTNTYSGPTTVSAGAILAGAANSLSPRSAITVGAPSGSGTLDVTAAPQTVSALTIGSLGTLNISDLYPLSVSGSAAFVNGSSIDVLTGGIVTPDLLMTYASSTGTLTNVCVNGVLGLPVGDSLSYSGGSLEIVSNVAASGGTWTQAGGGSWTVGGNWSSNPTVPTSGAVAFPELGAASAISVTLDGPQSAGAMVFSATEGYSLAPGTSGTLTLGTSAGGSVTVLVGTHTISAPLILAGSADIAPAAGSRLTISGNISETNGSQSLTLSDAGTLEISGSNGYTGGTNVLAGTLVIDTSTALADGSSLTVGQGASALFAPASAAPSLSAAPAGVTAVPEPGTLALLAVAAMLVAAGPFCRKGLKC
jgi:fibronectin-binding autotransporter adhesin